MMNRREFLVASLGSSLVGGTFLLSGCQPAAGAGSLSVGANLPSSGELGVYGTAIRNGSQLAVLDLPEDQRAAIRIDWQDNAGDGQRASSIARTQLTTNPDVVISGLKPQTAAIQSLVSANGAIHFPWILDVTINRGEPKRNFRIWVSFKLELQVFEAIVRARQPRRVALWYFNTEAGVEQYSRFLAPFCRQLGAEVMEEVIQSDSTNYHAVAARIAAFSPDLIFLNGFIPHMLAQVRALRPLGLIRPGQVVGSLDLLDAASQLQPAEIEGVYVSAPTFVAQPGPSALAWTERYRRQYREAPSYHAAYAYDMMSAIARARTQPLPEDRRLRIEELARRLTGTSFEGVTGPIRLDADQSLGTALRLCQFQAGRPVSVQLG